MKTLLLTTSFLLTVGLLNAEKKPFAPKDFAKGRPFSAAILSGGTLYVSGQVGVKKDGSYPEKFEDEVKQCFDNIDEILKSAGHSMQDLVMAQVFLTDMETFQRMNDVYVKVVPEPRPTRTTVGVAKLVGTARIEITVTARK